MDSKKFAANWLTVTVVIGLSLSCSTRAFDHSHGLWTQVLEKYVHDAHVNYKDLKNDTDVFNKYIAQLATVTSDELSRWSRAQKLAYWINAYNAYTIQAIVDHYPVTSIKKIPGVWKKRKFKAGGEQITLDEIEHKKLRAELQEPRIHFAVNCASIGCPVISNEAYQAEKLDPQFERSVKAMLTNADQFRIDKGKNRIYLSKILEWFGDDFKKFEALSQYGKSNGPVSFLLHFLPASDQRYIKSNKLTVKWLDYDWRLNEVPMPK